MSSVTKKLMNATIGLVLVGLILMTNLSFAQEEGGYGSQIRSPHRKLLQADLLGDAAAMAALYQAEGLTAAAGTVNAAVSTAGQVYRAGVKSAASDVGNVSRGVFLPGE